MEKRHYINKNKDKILYLSKLHPKKSWMQHIIGKTKYNNMIPNNMISLRDWNNTLKIFTNIVMWWTTFQMFIHRLNFFSIEDINPGVKWLAEGKSKDIKGYQTKILKIGRPILIPHIHYVITITILCGIQVSVLRKRLNCCRYATN
jgi:hypothetical protein